MDRTTAPNYATISGKRAFQNANPTAGIPDGTGVEATDMQAFQEELMAVIEGTGQTGNAANLGQVIQGIKIVGGVNLTAITSVAGGSTVALTVQESGLVEINATAGNCVITLPAVNAVDFALSYKFLRADGSANTVTIEATGGAEFFPIGATSFVLPPGKVVEVCSDQTNWVGTNLELGVSPYMQGSGPVDFGANYNGTVSVSFTAPKNGTVVGFGSTNFAAQAIANVTSELTFNGTYAVGDGTLLSQTFYTGISVTRGEAVTIALTVTTTTDPVVYGDYRVCFIFTPDH